MTDTKQTPIPQDRVLPNLQLTEAETILVLTSLKVMASRGTTHTDALNAVLKKLELQRERSHRLIRRAEESEALAAIKRE